MTSKLLLAGRKAVITGAANGIGLATAARFGAEGAAVVLLDCEAEPVRRAAASISGGRAIIVDVRDEAALAAAVSEAEQALGGLDIVVANAAIEPIDDDRADRLDTAVWRRVIDINLTGVFLTAKFGLK